MRRAFSQALDQLASAGFEGGWRLAGLTPLEIEREISAFAARRRMELERLDDLAWLAGRYVSIGVNAPKRYPRKPDGVVRRPVEMDDAEMKRVFLRLSQGLCP